MESMNYIIRSQSDIILRTLERHKGILLLGPRQTGKTTLIKQLKTDLTLSLVQPDIRLRYEKDPSLLEKEVRALKNKLSKKPIVVLDEIQKVPSLLDVVQTLMDEHEALFILTGSSARKLRRGADVNLLPGRIVALRLDPFMFHEYPNSSLEELLLYGSLPGIITINNNDDRETDLESYVTTYLEEEVRSEALVRNLGHFARFLEYAASESGQIINYRKLSQEIGTAHTTISSYFQILEDCLIIERIEPLTKSKTRKKLTQAQKYLFFDLGVRRLAAQEGKPSRDRWGYLFEQFIGLELLRCSRLSKKKTKIRFWRDPNGPEVDWLIHYENDEYVPVEVKWTTSPRAKDIRYLQLFLSEYPTAKKAYVICRTPRRLQLDKNILALPWQEVDELIV